MVESVIGEHADMLSNCNHELACKTVHAKGSQYDCRALSARAPDGKVMQSLAAGHCHLCILTV